MKKRFPATFLKRLAVVTGKRSRTVVDHILEYGFISTEDLKETFGYDHPPRAVRDVREQGIPIETYSVVGKHGRKIAAYRFGNPKQARGTSQRGRAMLPKSIKKELLKRHGTRCAICTGEFDATHLQVDHRVPYEVAGDAIAVNPDSIAFMLVCGSCNRAKSWSCEHCTNWLRTRYPRSCRTCYWASPESYEHISMEDIRRIEIVWQGEREINEHTDATAEATEKGLSLPQFVKKVLRNNLSARDKRTNP
ncbi:MAG: HNH endonuclease signature motif containing protein [Pirellulales bacterium]